MTKATGVITLGAHSPKLDAVRELATKRGRTERRQFVVEGPTMLGEALGAGLVPESVFVTERASGSLPTELLEEETFLIPDRVMDRISDLETAPGILAVFGQPASDLEAMLGSGEAFAVLAGVGDPGNAGTLVRTAEIFGIGGAIFTADAVEPYNPKVARATMGAIFRMRVAVAEGRGLVEAARRHGYAIVAAVKGGVALPDYEFPERCLIAIGHERHGVSKSLPHYDQAIGIPQPGSGESLNASVAGGIIFFAFSQQCKRTIFEV